MLLEQEEVLITETNCSLQTELKYNSVEDIREAFGLRQPCDHIVKVVKELLDNDKLDNFEKAEQIKQCRGFGYTTEILLSALFAAQQYKVCLEGFNAQKSELLAIRARKMAVKLGINPDNILAAPLKLPAGTVVCGITTYYDRFRNS